MRGSSLKRWTWGVAALATIAVGVAVAVGGGTQQAKLTASGGAAGDVFGVSVAVSGDTALAGAYGVDSAHGAAYVYTRSGTMWTQQAKLSAADAANTDFLGYSVALAGDTAVAGAFHENNQGAAYVFTRAGTVWTQQAKLVAADAATIDDFGVAAAVDGDTAVVGAENKSSATGAAYVFTRAGTTWTQQAKLAAADGAPQDYFGHAVAVSGDTAVVGAYGWSNSANQGAVYVFTRTGTTWTQQAKLTLADAANNDFLGESVAVEGDTLAAGAQNKDSFGAVYVFTRTGTTWTQQAKLLAADAATGDVLGSSVALSGDAVVAGAYNKDVARGAAYVFRRTGTTWAQTAKLTAADGVDGDSFGYSVALSGDTAVAGAYLTNNNQGSAYVFDVSAPPAGYCLPTKVKAKANAPHPEKSTLTASGTLDTGSGVPDFSGAATFDVGGFHLDVPAFVAKGRTLTYSAGGVALAIAPAKSGSSHALFSVKVVGDLTGKVDLGAPLAFRFRNAANDLNGTATLAAGALALRAVTAPTLFVVKAGATVKGNGKDTLALTLGFATDGVVPDVAEDLSIGFGGTYTSTLAGGWVRKGNTWVHAAKPPGIVKAVVDYAKGTITVTGAQLDLGAFAAGGNVVTVTATRGTDTRTAGIRMALTGAKLAY